MAASRRVMSSRDSPMLYLCGERVPFLWQRTRMCVVDRREETARPLSLLIKPNRNRKAESKLHNYTGVSLTPMHMALTSLPFYFLFFFSSFHLSSILFFKHSILFREHLSLFYSLRFLFVSNNRENNDVTNRSARTSCVSFRWKKALKRCNQSKVN